MNSVIIVPITPQGNCTILLFLQWEISSESAANRDAAQNVVPSGGVYIHKHTKQDHHTQSRSTLEPKSAPHPSKGEIPPGVTISVTVLFNVIVLF